MAYTLVISLAPLTLALRYVGGRIIDSAALPESPLAGSDISAEKVAGQAYQWAGPAAAIVVAALILWGASSLFVQFVRAIHRIWGDDPASLLRRSLRSRSLAALLVLVMGLALFASAAFGNVAAQMARSLAEAGGGLGERLGWLANLAAGRVVVDFVFSAVLFAVAFTAVPRGDQKMRNVLPGVMLTAAAYALGQRVLGAYLARSARVEVLGDFGQFVAFLLWSYYTALIVLWGAEVTYQIAKRRKARTARGLRTT